MPTWTDTFRFRQDSAPPRDSISSESLRVNSDVYRERGSTNGASSGLSDLGFSRTEVASGGCALLTVAAMGRKLMVVTVVLGGNVMRSKVVLKG